MGVIKRRVLANSGFLDALGFTGGEPCIQPEPVLEVCSWAKSKGLETFLNTNASNPSAIKELLERRLLDYIAFDIKAPLRTEAYQRVAGLGKSVEKAERVVANVRKTIEVGKKFGVALEARTTVVPTLLDNEASIREIAAVVKDCFIYVLQEFSLVKEVLDKKLRRLKSADRELLIKLAEVALEAGVTEVYIRTRSRGIERITP